MQRGLPLSRDYQVRLDTIDLVIGLNNKKIAIAAQHAATDAIK